MKYRVVIYLLLLLMACHQPASSFDDLPLNYIQVIGSHNSYKQAIAPALFQVIQSRDSVTASTIDYEHIPLEKQLEMGLENLELDIYSDTAGGRYAQPIGMYLVPNQPPFDTGGRMKAPGFKVFHIIDIDFRSSAPTLVDYLSQLKTWSNAHPDHYPVFITVDIKNEPTGNSELADPETFTVHTLDVLDTVLFNHLGKENMITPNDVKGSYKTLNEAVLQKAWPTVKQARGRFLFLMDNQKEVRQLYIANHPSLTGRAMFITAEPATPEAATLVINDPKDPHIPELVKQGYLIRTRADADTRQARTNDYTDFEAASRSGAQIISTDYYLKSNHFKSGYQVRFDSGGGYLRANPVLVPHQ